MRARIVAHRPGNVVAYVALFAALGGVSYAATELPPNSVGTKQLKRNAVVPSRAGDGSLKRATSPA